MNQQLKKGLALLGAVLILFVAALIAMYGIMKSALSEPPPVHANTESIMRNLGSQSISALWVILGIFAIVWIISVVDAFLAGRKIDRLPEQDQ